MDSSIGSVLELLVLKNDAECTSQRPKWTSGARVMIIFRNFTYERSFADELFRGFEFRITITIWNYLRGSNFELLANTIFISRMSGLRINFRKNYDRIFSLFQGVLIPCNALVIARRWGGSDFRNCSIFFVLGFQAELRQIMILLETMKIFGRNSYEN